MDFQQIITLVCVCGALCGVGLLGIVLIVLRMGFGVVTDLLGGGGALKMKNTPPTIVMPPNPTGGYQAQAMPQVSSFEEALARQQAAKQSGAPYQAQNIPSQTTGAFPLQTTPTLPGNAPRPFGSQPILPVGPSIAPPRPSLTPGVPYQPPVFPRTQASGHIPDLAAQRLAARRSVRSQSDDRNDIYIDESGDGLDLMM